MKDTRVFQMIADIVNDDLKTWAAEWLCAAVKFRTIYDAPPTIEHFPPVMGPQWTDLRDFIGSGGLRQIALRQTAVMSPTKRSRESNGGGGREGKGLCWQQDKPGGCRRRNCQFEHHKKADRRDSSGGGGRGDSRGGSGTSGRGGNGGGDGGSVDGGGGGGDGSDQDP